MMRAGAWLWLLTIALVAVYFAIRWGAGITLESNILAMLPREGRDTAAQSVQDKLADTLSRRVVFLVGDSSPQKRPPPHTNCRLCSSIPASWLR